MPTRAGRLAMPTDLPDSRPAAVGPPGFFSLWHPEGWRGRRGVGEVMGQDLAGPEGEQGPMSDLDFQETQRLEQGVRELTAMALPPELRRLLREHVSGIVRYATRQGLLFQDPNPRTARTVGLYRDLEACQAAAAWLEAHSATEDSKAGFHQIATSLRGSVEVSSLSVPEGLL